MQFCYKLISIFIISLLCGISLKAQTITLSEGTLVSGHYSVDLGLSVEWATCNIGAPQPSYRGDYYAWGELEPKNKYAWENYKFVDTSKPFKHENYEIVASFSKYTIPAGAQQKNYDRSVLESIDDVATAQWGSSWRMPTVEEFNELITKCVWKRCDIGYIITGPNGNSILLPFCGSKYIDYTNSTYTQVNLWSKSLSIEDDKEAQYLYAGGEYDVVDLIFGIEDQQKVNQHKIFGGSRCIGMPIRPVRAKSSGSSASSSSTGTNNSHEWVDLGLSVKWATCNVGATTPEGYGGYYAWGETKTKNDYDINTYKWTSNGKCDGFSKYTYPDGDTESSWYSGGTFVGDGKTTLDLSDDAAHVNWGGSWRMPTVEEIEELIEKCTCTWTTQNGVNGYRISSNLNGNYIFLPAAGDSLDDAGSYGGYWSSSLFTDKLELAINMDFSSVGNNILSNCCGRGYGLSVRAVCP